MDPAAEPIEQATSPSSWGLKSHDNAITDLANQVFCRGPITGDRFGIRRGMDPYHAQHREPVGYPKPSDPR